MERLVSSSQEKDSRRHTTCDAGNRKHDRDFPIDHDDSGRVLDQQFSVCSDHSPRRAFTYLLYDSEMRLGTQNQGG